MARVLLSRIALAPSWEDRMPTCPRERLVLFTLVIALTGGVGLAQADPITITFDTTITSPIPPQNEIVDLEYHTPDPPAMPLTFATQGFSLGGFTNGVTPTNTTPELSIFVDPTLCPAAAGTTCVNNGTRYLGTADPFGMFVTAGGPFRLTSFQASQVFGPGGCPGCVDEGEEPFPNATSIQATGFRMGVIVAQESFLLSQGFQTYVLTDPDWANVNRVVFAPIHPSGNASAVAIDNINTTVPEPASLALLGAGLAGLAVRCRAARRAR